MVNVVVVKVGATFDLPYAIRLAITRMMSPDGGINSQGLEMDMTERLLRHDAWTTRLLLHRALDLSDEQLDREFDIGHRSLRRTFVHIIANMEWTIWTNQPDASRWAEDCCMWRRTGCTTALSAAI